KLLDDPFYIGLRRRRVRGPEYELLLDNFMKAATKRFGRDTLIQFEDFAFENAYTLLDRYKNEYCVFNDDIQGTASVVVAGLLAATRVTGKPLSEKKMVFLGAGAAGLGVAELCVNQMVDEGISEKEACDKIYMMDVGGLITKSRHRSLTDRHLRFAKVKPEKRKISMERIRSDPLIFQDMNETKSLLEVIQKVQPEVLIGASTVAGAFTEEIIREMARINKRPVIFALSNPTTKAECTAEAAYRFTDGSVLFASGSPFDNVELSGKIYKPGQGNNSYIFPGVALAAIVFKAKHIPDKAFLIAAREMYIRSQIYSVEYDELINKTYDWPAKDSKHGFPVPVLPRSSMDEE
ncbi:malic enzyme, NAD binding domain protein, partial [Necator americanus]